MNTIAHKTRAKTFRLKPANLRREKILKAATEIFAKKGLDDATIDEIAARAGVGKGTIYRQAGNKEDLIVILLKEAVLLVIDAIERKIQKRTDPILQFKEAVYALCDVYEDHLTLMALATPQMGLCIEKCKNGSRKNFNIEKEVFKLFATMGKILQKAIKTRQIKPVDPYIISKGFFDFLNPSLYHFLRSEKEYTQGEIAQMVIDLFLNGLKTKR